MRKFIGLILVVFGALVLADTLKVFGENISLWSYMWPSVLILFGLSGMIRRGSFRILSAFLVVVGGFYLAKNLGVEWFADKELHLFALFLVLLGIQLLFFSGWTKINRHTHDFIRPSRSNGKEFSAFMGGLEEKVVSDDFKGCSITAIMGGAEVDLSEVTLTRMSPLNVPPSWARWKSPCLETFVSLSAGHRLWAAMKTPTPETPTHRLPSSFNTRP